METVRRAAYGTSLQGVALTAARAVSFGACFSILSGWSVACYIAYACRWLNSLCQNGVDRIRGTNVRGGKHCSGAPGQKYGTGAAAGLAATADASVREVKMMAWRFIMSLRRTNTGWKVNRLD